MTLNLATRRGNLTEAVIERLNTRIESGAYGRGEKLPSEQALCAEFGVSRTVLREAVASLRLGGRLIARQGVGVFVPEGEAPRLPFKVSPPNDLRSALHILELRLAVETEGVALAAARRTPASLSEVTAAFDGFNALDASDPHELAQADFRFHLALARATGNEHFPAFLEALGPQIIFDLVLKHERLSEKKTRRSYLDKIAAEHGAILSALSLGNSAKGRQSVKRHLEASMTRYRRLITPEGAPNGVS